MYMYTYDLLVRLALCLVFLRFTENSTRRKRHRMDEERDGQIAVT